MGRPTIHHVANLVGAAQALAAAGTPDDVTIGAVARMSGAPVGSIYHRFGGRDQLLAAAWLDALSAFQAVFLPALADDAGPPGLAAARVVTAWSRDEPVRARVLVLHRARDFRSEHWGGAERDRARGLAADLEGALAAFCERHLGASGGESRRLATFALLDLPQAAVRRYLAAGIPPPDEVDGYVATALAGLLAGGRN